MILTRVAVLQPPCVQSVSTGAASRGAACQSAIDADIEIRLITAMYEKKKLTRTITPRQDGFVILNCHLLSIFRFRDATKKVVQWLGFT